MTTDKEKLIKLLCEANSKSVDAELFEDSCYAQQLEIEADYLIANGVTIWNWIPVTERLPENFISMLGYMTDAGPFPFVRECYTVGNAFFFPALQDIHPVSHWMPLPDPPKEAA